jgi:hypothetical protein
MVEDRGFMEFVGRSLGRHMDGDWGEVCQEDEQTNEDALKAGARLMSVYSHVDETKVWVITESDRSATTVLFPEEY